LERGKGLRLFSRAPLAVLFVCALTVVGAPAAARPSPPTKLLGNDRALLENADGGVLACLPGRESATRGSVACGVVDLRSAVLSVVPQTYFVQMGTKALAVLKSAATPTDDGQRVLQRPQPARQPTFGRFAARSTGRTVALKPGMRLSFAGTSVGCTVAKNGSSVTCQLVDAAFKPVPGSHGFTLSFRSLQVFRTTPAGKSAVVLTRRHGG
jgi:hypothetical protein